MTLIATITEQGFKILDKFRNKVVYQAGNSRTQSQVYYDTDSDMPNEDLATYEQIKGYAQYIIDEIKKDNPNIVVEIK